MSQGELMAEAAAPRSLAGLQAMGDDKLTLRTLWIDGDFRYTRGEVFAARDSWRSDGDTRGGLARVRGALLLSSS